MAKVSFYLDRPNREESLVYIRVADRGTRYLVSTGQKVPTKFWLKEKQRLKVTKAFPFSQDLNVHLNDIQRFTDNLLLRRKSEGNPIKPSTLKLEILQYVGRGELLQKAKKFFDSYDEFLKQKQEEVKILTLKKDKTLKKLLLNFETRHRVKLELDEIDFVFERKFTRYLNNDLKQVNDTSIKYIECLKTFLRWANQNQFTENKTYEQFTIRRQKDRRDIIALSEEELNLLISLDLDSGSRFEKLRDSFVFQCYTGQRFSDIQNLKWSDLKKSGSEVEWQLYQIKGNKPRRIDVPLFPYPQSILKRLGGYFGMDKKVFDTISNVKTNLLLKELCKKANINKSITIVRYRGKERVEITAPKFEFISTHCARRTFVTISLINGMTPELVMDITGHDDYKTMKRYLTVFKDVRNQEAKKIWGRPLMKVAK